MHPLRASMGSQSGVEKAAIVAARRNGRSEEELRAATKEGARPRSAMADAGIAIGAFVVLACVVFGGIGGYMAWTAEPYVPAPLPRVDDETAFTVAAHILARGEVRGCGSFEIAWRDREAKSIRVLCGNGREHNLVNGPMLKVDGKVVGW